MVPTVHLDFEQNRRSILAFSSEACARHEGKRGAPAENNAHQPED
jgi:hypothetical protein